MQLDIHTIGAGGGSIVHRLDDGTLSIGRKVLVRCWASLLWAAVLRQRFPTPIYFSAVYLQSVPLRELKLNESLASEAFRT